MLPVNLMHWSSVLLPPVGSQRTDINGHYSYALHLANRFKTAGTTLVNRPGYNRRTKGPGNDYIESIAKLNEGSYRIYEEGGENGMLIMTLLFEDGVVYFEISNAEDRWGSPDLSDRCDIYLNITGSREFVEAIQVIHQEGTETLKSTGNIYALVSGMNGPTFQSIGHGGEKLIRENYSEGVLANYDRIVETLQAEVPPGRINILSGPAGSGKSFIIRGLLEEITDVKFAIIQANTIAHLVDPGTLPAIVNFKSDGMPIVFVIEDADECLATRDAGNMASVSAVLNMGDGLIGSMLDIRIIATTNQAITDLDPAIRRPGRLSTICEVGPLTHSEASKIYHRLTDGKAFPGNKKEFTIAEIYQMATDSGWRPAVKERKTVGFNNRRNEETPDSLHDFINGLGD